MKRSKSALALSQLQMDPREPQTSHPQVQLSSPGCRHSLPEDFTRVKETYDPILQMFRDHKSDAACDSDDDVTEAKQRKISIAAGGAGLCDSTDEYVGFYPKLRYVVCQQTVLNNCLVHHINNNFSTFIHSAHQTTMVVLLNIHVSGLAVTHHHLEGLVNIYPTHKLRRCLASPKPSLIIDRKLYSIILLNTQAPLMTCV